MWADEATRVVVVPSRAGLVEVVHIQTDSHRTILCQRSLEAPWAWRDSRSARGSKDDFDRQALGLLHSAQAFASIIPLEEPA